MIQPVDPHSNSPDENPYLDALQEVIEQEVRRHNSKPDPAMGGLSPEQAYSLLYSRWGEPGSMVQFERNLNLELLNTSSIFRRARLLLLAIAEAGGVKATVGKNLNRKFVESFVSHAFDREDHAWFWQLSKKLDEMDVWALHVIRVVCEQAKLLRLYKGTFRVPENKRSILSDGAAADLFRLLFVTFCRKFNISYFHPRGPERSFFQRGLGYTIYRIGVLAPDWFPVDGLASRVMLPAEYSRFISAIRDNPYQDAEDVFSCDVLRPLIEWGLIEAQRAPSAYSYVEGDIEKIRTTALYRALLRFESLVAVKL